MHLYLAAFGIDAGETLHGFRCGFLINREANGLTLEQGAEGNWRTMSVANDYSRFTSLMSRSGFSSNAIANMTPDQRLATYERMDAETLTEQQGLPFFGSNEL